MNNNRHPSKSELVELLNTESDEVVLTETVAHLRRCEFCQKQLDQLAAKPEQWSKTIQILQESGAADTLSCTVPRTIQVDQVKQSENSSWQYSASEMLTPAKHPELLGKIGEYDIECEVGRGGMGVVFKAFDSKLHRVVAIKVLAPHLAGNGTARKRFAQEAIATAGVIHPNVIAVHSVDEQSDAPFIVMPFVNGVSLQALVGNQGPLAEIDIAKIALQISAGLSAAHSQGLVHRDIKPANILVETGVNRVVITDFGLARAADDASLTQTGWLAGTPNYMSPEQTRGQRPDQRSDLFSLGSTLYFLATGCLPFRAETALGVLARIQTESPTPVRQINPRLSTTSAELIDRLLAKQPENRFQSAAELHGVLEKLLQYLRQPEVSEPPQINSKSNSLNTEQESQWLIRLMFAGALVFAVLAFAVTAMILTGTFSKLLPTGNWSSVRIRPSASSEFDSLDYSNRESDGKLLIENATNFLLLKRFDEAIELFEEAAKFPDFAAQANYNLGCAWALKGDTDRAFSSLETAINQGFDQVKLFRTDNDLDSLRNDLRFKELMQRLK